jgi:hypothetical protein
MANKPRDPEMMKIHLNAFQGGMAIDFKYGIANSFYYSQGLDFRQKASQMSVLPGMRTFSSTLEDLILCMVQDPTGKRYATGSSGWVYRLDTSGDISVIGQLDSASGAGISYNQQSDQVYMTSQQTVSMYGKVQGSPMGRIAQFAKSASTTSGVVNLFNATDNAYDGAARNNAQSVPTGITSPSQVTDSTSNVYTVTNTTVVESIGQFCYFAPDIEPFYSIAVYVKAIGSGNLTLTLHDSLNNKLAQVTINNGSLVLGWNEFVFTTPGVRALVNSIGSGSSATYHFHLTSSVANDTTTVGAVNAGDLTGCDFLLFAYRLASTNNTWHPAVNFAGYLCIGNGQYLSTYDYTNDAAPNNQQWQRHRLPLDFGYEVCGLSVNNQYLVIAAEKRSASTTHSYQEGALYFWDGVNTIPNFKIQVPMGAPYSVFTLNNITYFYCAGSLFAWGGGQQVIKVRYISYQNTDYLGTTDNTIINPQMMDARYNLLMLGFPSSTTNTNINYGVYSWGAVELTYPNSFGYSYALSNGLQNFSSANNLQIGMIKNFVDTMYMSWQYTDANSVTHWGLDILDNTSTPAPNFSWQSLIYDGGARYKTKRAMRYKINFLPLPANTTVTAQYNIDRNGWVTADSFGNSFSAATGDTSIVVEMNNARFHELQWGFVGTSSPSATTPPTFTGITMEINPLLTEHDVRKDT